MPALPIQLEYSGRLPWQRRRRFRLTLMLALAAALTPVLARAGLAGWRHAKLLYFQHQCLTHAAPANEVVLDTVAARSIKYGSHAAYLAGAPPQPTNIVGPSGNTLAAWDSLNTLIGNVAVPGDATAFAHARSAGNQSPRRLVVLEIHYSPVMCFGPKVMFEAHVFDPGTLFRKPIEMNSEGNRWLHDFESWYEPGEQLIVFAGEADPDDPARFRVPYLRVGRGSERSGVIEGQLLSDDRVVLTHRETQ